MSRMLQFLYTRWWICKGRLWVWRWGRWLKHIHRVEPPVALMEITRLRWYIVTHAGYDEKWESMFLKALEIHESLIRAKVKRLEQPDTLCK